MSFSPTPEQQAIYTAWTGTKKSLMIDALAGTGKTTTLVGLSEVMEQGKKEETLVLVFNKKNKEEMAAKFPRRYDVMTLSGLGYRALSRGLNRKLQLNSDKNAAILKSLLDGVPKESLPREIWSDTMALVSTAKTAGYVPEDWTDKLHPLVSDIDADELFESWCDERFITPSPELFNLVRQVLSESIRRGLDEAVIDFDDMIYLSVLGAGAYRRYPVVLVDEAQDLSRLNHLQLKKSLDFLGRLVVVGDPRQAIYAFRGAHSKSMGEIRNLRREDQWVDLSLSVTFRCPHSVVRKAQAHVPHYIAHESNPEGEVLNYANDSRTWGVETLPAGKVAILCRNNAPLMKAAFRLISTGHGCQFLGRDLGKNLLRLLETISGKGNKALDLVLNDIAAWERKELEKAAALKKSALVDHISDRAECFRAVAEFHKVTDLATFREALTALFESSTGRFTLATGHKAKGLEWPTVVHLDPWRIPSPFALKAEEFGNPGPLEQEKNLRYVLETRAQKSLILANLADFEP